MNTTLKPPGARQRRHSLLVVDDTPINLAVLQGMLEPSYDLTLASSGPAALAAAAGTRFDLVLLDVMMPGIDGFETLRQLRELPGFGQTPTIFVTANNDNATERIGLAMGAVDYLVKLLVLEHVRLRIANVLRNADLQRQLALALDSAELGLWDWAVDNGGLGLDPRRAPPLEAEPADPQAPPSWADYVHPAFPEDRASVEQALQDCLNGEGNYLSEYRLCRPDGSILWVEDRGKVVEWSPERRPLRMVGSIQDITSRKLAEEEVSHLAFHDFLTGLPNRRLLMERLQQTLLANTRSRHWSAVIFLDMDRFKHLNDTLGHEAGDALLAEVGRRLTACVRSSDTVARLGGDEFVVLLGDLGTAEESAREHAVAVGEKIRRALNADYDIAHSRFRSTPSLGVSVFSGQPATAEGVLKLADEAMYEAKAGGRNCLHLSARPVPAEDAPAEASGYLMSSERPDRLIAAHHVWGHDFRHALAGSGAAHPRLERAHDDRACELGQWLASGASLGLLGGRAHEKIMSLHQAFHARAGEIAQQLRHPSPPGTLDALLKAFDALSAELVDQLLKARKKL